MTEYAKRELALNTTFSRLFWDEALVYTTTNNAQQTFTGRYLYQGAGIFQVQQVYLTAISNQFGYVTDLGERLAYTWTLKTLKGYLLKPVTIWGDQLYSMNQSYDNLDHAPLLTNDEGYLVEATQNFNIGAVAQGAVYRLGVIGIEYLD